MVRDLIWGGVGGPGGPLNIELGFVLELVLEFVLELVLESVLELGVQSNTSLTKVFQNSQQRQEPPQQRQKLRDLLADNQGG